MMIKFYWKSGSEWIREPLDDDDGQTCYITSNSDDENKIKARLHSEWGYDPNEIELVWDY